MGQANTTWSRAIILVDMNAFFASVEQYDFPELRGWPVAVTNGEQGSCIITCSYEARAHGIKTGVRLKDAKKLCSNIIQRPARPERYAEVSSNIMQSLQDITPDIEIFSVDEAFLDVTYCQTLADPITLAKRAKDKVFEVSGLYCSIGLSGDKTTAKYAAKLQKPNGFSVILPWEAKEKLKNVPVTDLCGIGNGIGNFLAQRGIYTCGDMEKLPIGILAKRFGNLGRRIWYMCQGADPDLLHKEITFPKSMGHGKVIPPNTADRNLILVYLQHMSEKLAHRLRQNKMDAQIFYIGIKTYEFGWIGDRYSLSSPSNDGQLIFWLCKKMIHNHWYGYGSFQIQITALDPRPLHQQADLFESPDEKRNRLNQAMDEINDIYGAYTVAPAPLLHRSASPDVIAPAWKPGGHRQTIQKTKANKN